MKHNNFIYSALPNSMNFVGHSLTATNKMNADFIVQAFDGIAKYFTCQETDYKNLNFVTNDLEVNTEHSCTKEEHISKVEKAIVAIAGKTIQKVIVAKRSFINSHIDVVDVLKSLKDAFPSAFVYALKIKNSLWLGATPEVLITGNNEHGYNVDALAGTKKNNEIFTEKEIIEQKVVADYVESKLSQLVDDLKIHPTQEKQYGNIKHLLNTFSFKSDKPLEVAKQLHPTPAILGLPKKEAKDFIIESENFERKYYCGFLGFYNKKESNLFVNLRCGQVFKNGVMLYSGGGITQDSNAEAEWQESENKVATFTQIIKQNSIASI